MHHDQPAPNAPAFGAFDIQEFYRCYAWLEAACRAGIGLNMDLLLEGLTVGEYTLWTSLKAAGVTEILDLPEGRVMSFTCAGGDLTELLELHRKAEDLARHQGIHKFMVMGRAGWEKALEGFSRKSVILTKGW